MDRQRWMVAFAATIALVLVVASPAGAQTCRITAPAHVAADASFTLCAPTASGYTYEWYGPGLTGNSTSRCASASGLSAGTYEFLLIRSRDGVEVDRCTHIVNVGGRSGGASSCRVSGPASIQSGSTATLCAPNDGIHSYSWRGPNGFTATTACITVSAEGTYFLTSRNPFTGSSRTCTHRLDVVGTGGGGAGTNCAISGPDIVSSGGTARLCATSRSNTSYRWTGPGGFTATARCITVSAPGTYTVTLRNLTTGRLDQCTRELRGEYDDTPDADDPDAVYSDNCPRNLPFWRSAVRQGAGAGLFSATELTALAREIDRRSTYFNWSNDVSGLRSALSPAAPLTRRKQIARQYVALLANVVAGEMGLQGEEPIGLDPGTPITFQGASTIGELIALTERWLRENRGNFSQLNAKLNQINRGRGIGPVCNDIP